MPPSTPTERERAGSAGPARRRADGRLLAGAGITAAVALAVAAGVVIAQEAADADGPAGPGAAAASDAPTAPPSEGAVDDVPLPEPDVEEEASWSPRLVVGHDGGVQVLDAVTFDVLADLEVPGVTGLAPAGDGRHVLAATPQGHRVVDAGSFADAHGDHAHYYTRGPRLTDALWSSSPAGTVVNNADMTSLFDPATGRVTMLPEPEVGLGPDAGYEPAVLAAGSPHPGFAVPLADGGALVSEGTPDGVTGVRLLAAGGAEVAAAGCADQRGVTVAAQDTVVVGCGDEVLVVADGTVTAVPVAAGRVTSLAGSTSSGVVVGTLEGDAGPVAEVLVVDVVAATARTVPVPAPAGASSLAVGGDGTVVVLGTDGVLHELDAVAGAVARSLPLLEPWEAAGGGPVPSVVVFYGSAVVIDPATQRVVAADLATGDVWLTAELSVTPLSLVAVSGDMELGAAVQAGSGATEG